MDTTMSIIVVDRQVVHYEVFGRGRPVLFLHGWLGSWRYWFPTMERTSEHFRTYSFDFWGFGDSRRQTTTESIQAYSNQVIRFLDELGIDRIQLVGHSMGGMVALKTAINHPRRVSRVAAVGAPILGGSPSLLLQLTQPPLLGRPPPPRPPVPPPHVFPFPFRTHHPTLHHNPRRPS